MKYLAVFIFGYLVKEEFRYAYIYLLHPTRGNISIFLQLFKRFESTMFKMLECLVFKITLK